MAVAPSVIVEVPCTAESRVSTTVDAQHSGNLDLLRSFAVGSVLCAHSAEVMGSSAISNLGHLGVLLFFVHTSFVLLQSLERLHKDGGGRPAVRFLLQRIFRIYPLYLAAIGFSLLLRIPWVENAAWAVPGWKGLAANLLMIQNLTFLPSISFPMWSLAYEMQMYVALPAVYLITRQTEPITKLLLLSFFSGFAAVCMSMFVALPFDGMHQPITYFVPCFLGGAYAFTVTQETRRGRLLSWKCFALFLCALAIVFSISTHVPMLQYLICTALGFALPRFTDISNPRIRGVCKTIATYSYGIYLWHWPLLWLWFYKAQGLSTAARATLFLFSLAVLVVSSYHLIEAPLVRFGKTLTGRKGALVLAHRPRSGDAAA